MSTTGDTVASLLACALVAAGAGAIVLSGYALTLAVERVAARVLRRRTSGAGSDIGPALRSKITTWQSPGAEA